MTCHVFAETTHVVTALSSFAWLVLASMWLYILSFIEICSWVENRPSSLVWLVAYTTVWDYCLSSD